MSESNDLSDPTARAIERFAFAGLVPLWIAAGACDYVLHRRSQIERTSGVVESRLHAIGIALTAPPVLAALTLEIDAGVIAIMGTGALTHVVMTAWDVAYADSRRRIAPLEQHVHAVLASVPPIAFALVTIAHRDRIRAIGSHSSFALRRKRRPIPARALLATVTAFTLFVALPFGEELLRCVRYARKRR